MARTVNEESYASKRNEILDVTLRLIYTKGYEQMSIQDILTELHMSKGAFYHYFSSKADLLEALMARMQQETLQLLTPIVRDPQLSALEKLQRYIDTGVRWKNERVAFIVDLLRVWYADHNAIVRQKIWAAMSRQTVPLIGEIFEQGIREGVLQIAFPDQIGTLFISLIYGLGDAFTELVLAEPQGDELQRAERLIAAYNDALERLLGAPSGSIHLMSTESLGVWFPASGERPALGDAQKNGQ